MHSTHLLLEEPIRMVSVLEPSKPSFFPAMTKIVGTLGPKSRSVEVISACLKAGMSGTPHRSVSFQSADWVLLVTVARFDFSWGDVDYHQETLQNLKTAIKSTQKLCAIMLDTVGPELQVINKSEKAISLEADAHVILTPDQEQEASSQLLPINFSGLSKASNFFFLPIMLISVKQGDTIFIGQYLFTGSETTSVWLEVSEVKGADVVCIIKNTATLAGSLFTLHVSQIHIDLPTLSEADKNAISTWGVRNKIDFLSLSYTRHAEDVRQAREFLSKLGSDAILLGAETLRGLYPVETISTVGRICYEVRAAIKVKASVIICFTSSGRAARLIAKYRPTMPVLSVVIPRLKTNQLRWSFSGAFEARQSLIVRGLFPMLADPRHPAESTSSSNESVLKVALDHGKASGLIKTHDRVVVCQKVGDASVVKIIELED
ncbi:hypothetical protein C4D60_Mb06t13980 [Musa balbisiana]|uniref:pyruvate kinase n=1 Tax=Musa balbisiana TaxID=52838 RepID=A0A4S8IMU5_MUSBA|nr:hypothetical protein C4D60_Mb06t13980 [Musa balbisiana]